MILLFASSKFILLVLRKSEENCSLEVVAPLVARRLAIFEVTEVKSEILTAEILIAVAVVAAVPRFLEALTLRACSRFRELIDIEEPESPLVEI
jgi:hypothetical protein